MFKNSDYLHKRNFEKQSFKFMYGNVKITFNEATDIIFKKI